MEIAVIGSGYVGLVTGACFADMGNSVVCVDIDEKKIEKLNKGIIPIYEPGLKEIVERNVEEGRLSFTLDLASAVEKSLFIFIAVGTPPDGDGSADLSHVLKVAQNIGKHMNGYKVIINKSTVPVGTAMKVKNVLTEELRKRSLATLEFDVVSNPEFLKEGAAIDDFMKPDRIVVGVESEKAGELMKELYTPFVRNGHPVYLMDIPSSELSKYAANVMLATRISFMNEMARICDATGADIEKIRVGIGSDSRIGMSFLYAGIGYGGSCFPKDVQALLKTAKSLGIDSRIFEAVEAVNEEQKKMLVERVKRHFGENLSKRRFAIWGLSFKPNTDDMREAPSIQIITGLKKAGALISAHDPVANEAAKGILGDEGITYFEKSYDALKDADAMLLLTEWHQFRNPDFERIKKLLKAPVIFDGRNQYNPAKLRGMGFTYYSIGRP